MKVSELKKLLKGIPNDADVIVYDRDDSYYDVRSIKSGYVRRIEYPSSPEQLLWFNESLERLQISPELRHAHHIKEMKFNKAVLID